MLSQAHCSMYKEHLVAFYDCCDSSVHQPFFTPQDMWKNKKQEDAVSLCHLHDQRHWTYLFGVGALFPLLRPLCGGLDWGLVAREPWRQNSALGIDNWGFYLKWETNQKGYHRHQKCTVIDKYDLVRTCQEYISLLDWGKTCYLGNCGFHGKRQAGLNIAGQTDMSLCCVDILFR